MLKVTLFDNAVVKNLTDEDFLIGTMNAICLREPDSVIVLFYDNNLESKRLVKVFAEVAKATVVGPLMAGCCIPFTPKLFKSMNELQKDINSPLADFAIRGLPTIMVYRERWPVAVYAGQRDVQSLVDYRNFLANRPTYREPTNRTYGTSVKSDGNNEEEEDDDDSRYRRFKAIKSSRDFRSGSTGGVDVEEYEPLDEDDNEYESEAELDENDADGEEK